MHPFDYEAPSSVDQAVSLLADGGSAVALAGGQRLVAELKVGSRRPSLLVDLRGLPELRTMTPDGANGRTGVRLGAMVTLDSVARSDAVMRGGAALAEAAAAVGDQQVRNRSTIGGGLVDARPGADVPPALVALQAEVETAGPGGRRTLDVEAVLLAGLEPGAIVTAIRVPAAGAGAGSAYRKLRDPASCYAICGVAVAVRAGDSGRIADCRVAVTGMAAGVVRLRELEAAMAGAAPSARRIASQFAAAAGRLDPISDLAASGEYRAHLVAVLGEQALRQALDRAGLPAH